MKELDKLTDKELIDYVYYDLAGKFIQDNVRDWREGAQLIDAVNKLPEQIRNTYLIGVLNMQVMNGGFIQYYDNGYGCFAPEALIALQEIKASLMYDLLKQSIDILNSYNFKQVPFKKYILNRGYPDHESIDKKLDELDTQYYNLEDKEDLESLLGVYLRVNIEHLKL